LVRQSAEQKIAKLKGRKQQASRPLSQSYSSDRCTQMND
jgi:hypothetical protein